LQLPEPCAQVVLDRARADEQAVPVSVFDMPSWASRAAFVVGMIGLAFALAFAIVLTVPPIPART